MLPVTLSALIAVPFVGGIGAWLFGRRAPGTARWVALLSMAVTFCMALWLWLTLSATIATTPEPVLQQRFNWIPQLGVDYHLALDGLNVLFVVLTGFLGCVAVLTSWREIKHSPGLHYRNLAGRV